MTSHDTRCPSCNETLQPARTTWHVLACSGCGGVWTDAAASRRIVSVVDRELVEVANVAAAQVADRETPDPNASTRGCPVCSAVLRPVRAARVTVDVCAEHGTWFDRDELGRLARNLAYERTSDPGEQAGSTTMLLDLLDG